LDLKDILACNSNIEPLAEAISNYLDLPLHQGGEKGM